jgi:hypothetical protein
MKNDRGRSKIKTIMWIGGAALLAVLVTIGILWAVEVIVEVALVLIVLAILFAGYRLYRWLSGRRRRDG